ncbi:GAF domain-containing protein [Planotetraspora sp. A-T 1434]|uniref:GAF domain-containing protein n=1 Tax=Planotetraspora sp. A-T 1434 TaxID=2979219 RepID=UPI0021C0549C|nr:GAF domain-containing protein [Planotetraspora sp. A-T 1434]MCT9934110.1 GAF domain-containing protein [Planotetraspora sp. A-T 1434]
MGPDAPLVLENVLVGMADLFGVDGAALMLFDGQDRLRAIGASDDDGILLESAQESVGDGPAIASAACGDSVAINDLHAATPLGFPHVAAHAMPVRAVLSVPLIEGSELIGVLDFYARIGRDWDCAEVETGSRLGELMVIVLQVLAESRTDSFPFGQV